MRINNKQEFYNRSRRLELGNRLQQWDYYAFHKLYFSFDSHEIPLRVSLRTTRIASVKAQRYRLVPYKMINLCERLLHQGFSYNELFVDESAPDHCVQLQAEVMNTERFVYVRYVLRSGVGMREALVRSKHIEGAAAMHLLRSHLDCDSMDTLERLLQEYPDAVVELSAYPHKVGMLQKNTLFWEVRNY